MQVRLDIAPLGRSIDEIRISGTVRPDPTAGTCAETADLVGRFASNLLLPIDPAYHHLVGGSRLVWTLHERSGWLRLASANFVHIGVVHLWLNCVGLLRATSLLRSINVSEADLLRIMLAAGLATTVFGAAQVCVHLFQVSASSAVVCSAYVSLRTCPRCHLLTVS